jgi:hypothetical protein
MPIRARALLEARRDERDEEGEEPGSSRVPRVGHRRRGLRRKLGGGRLPRGQPRRRGGRGRQRRALALRGWRRRQPGRRGPAHFNPTRSSVRVYDLEGRVLAEFTDRWAPAWTPDGRLVMTGEGLYLTGAGLSDEPLRIDDEQLQGPLNNPCVQLPVGRHQHHRQLGAGERRAERPLELDRMSSARRALRDRCRCSPARGLALLLE